MRPLLVWLCLGLALAVAGCGPAKEHGPETGAWYVAIGDSGTSGAGIGPVADAGCARSKRDYPALLAAELHVPSFADVSCGGASTENLLTRKQTVKTGERPLQIAAVGSRTRLVTVGIGLNDFGLSYALLYQCIALGKISDACQKYLDTPATGFAPFIAEISKNVQAVVEAVQRRAPKARVVLVDYPRYAPDSGSCADRMPMPAAAVERARTVLAEVSAAYRKIAEKTGALFAGMYQASEGHDVCSSHPWVHGFRDGTPNGAALHPYPAYHRAVADRIAALLGTS